MNTLDSAPSTAAIYPDFVYIGASKAGSSWIYEILREHPDVFVPLAKDIQFFDWHYDKGIDWYLSFFRQGGAKKAIGEVSHDYFLVKEAAWRIQEHLPEVRLFCSLREPVGQLLSTFVYRQNTTLDRGATFGEFSAQKSVRQLCDYYHNLLPFYRLFPRDKIMVLFFDDIEENPTLVAKRIYEFLGVDPAFVPGSLHRRVLPASEPRSYWLAHLVYGTGTVLRKMGLANVVGAVKRDRTFQKLFSRPIAEKPDLSRDVARELREYYRERYRDLPELIGQPLPMAWF